MSSLQVQGVKCWSIMSRTCRASLHVFKISPSLGEQSPPLSSATQSLWAWRRFQPSILSAAIHQWLLYHRCLSFSCIHAASWCHCRMIFPFLPTSIIVFSSNHLHRNLYPEFERIDKDGRVETVPFLIKETLYDVVLQHNILPSMYSMCRLFSMTSQADR